MLKKKYRIVYYTENISIGKKERSVLFWCLVPFTYKITLIRYDLGINQELYNITGSRLFEKLRHIISMYCEVSLDTGHYKWLVKNIEEKI